MGLLRRIKGEKMEIAGAIEIAYWMPTPEEGRYANEKG